MGVEWDVSAYRSPIRATYESAGGGSLSCDLNDLDLDVDRENCGEETIRVVIGGESLSYPVDFSLTSDVFFELVSEDQPKVVLTKGREEITLIDYLNSRPLNFHFSSSAQLSLLRGNELFTYDASRIERFDPEQIIPVDWSTAGVEITAEFPTEKRDLDGLLTIHEFLEN